MGAGREKTQRGQMGWTEKKVPDKVLGLALGRLWAQKKGERRGMGQGGRAAADPVGRDLFSSSHLPPSEMLLFVLVFSC